MSVVLIGYKRPDHLRRTVESFRATNRYEPVELILADDGSPPELQAQMRDLPIDRCLLGPVNRGLGANTNAGLDEARGDFILQLQDDWLCEGPPDFLSRGVRLMQQRTDVGIVRFTMVNLPEPTEVISADDGLEVHLFRGEGRLGLKIYSDQPHLKSRAFLDYIGPYKESRWMQKTELDMEERVLRQDRFSVAAIPGYHVFRHIGDEATHRRMLPKARLGLFMDRIPVLRMVARIYRSQKNARLARLRRGRNRRSD